MPENIDPDKVPEIPDAELVERAVRNSLPQVNRGVYRWACVARTFGCGSTVAQTLCRRFNLNADDVLRPPRRNVNDH
jgi:hypothetical protein